MSARVGARCGRRAGVVRRLRTKSQPTGGGHERRIHETRHGDRSVAAAVVAFQQPIGDSSALVGAPYLISAGPRQECVWGSRTRPLPQPPTRSPADTLGAVTVGSEGATPAVTTGANAGLV